MAIAQAQQKAVTKYIKNHYDKITVFFEKGKKDILKNHCLKYGYSSVNEFVNKAIEKQIETDIFENIETGQK